MSKFVSEFDIETSKFSIKIASGNLTESEINLILLKLEMQINEKHFKVELPNKGKLTLATRIHINKLNYVP